MVQSWITRLLGKDGKKSLSSEIPALSSFKESKMYELRRHGTRFKIYEKKTKRYIAVTSSETEAKDIFKKLNNGSAFEGNTPNFFTAGTQYGLDYDKKVVDIEKEMRDS